ncbi:MAG: hypothetical protein ACLQUY_26950 [Ktedonobacterales bacterium]
MKTLRLISRAGAATLLLAGTMLALGACGSGSQSLGTKSSPPAVLRCEFAELPQPTDPSVFQGELSCQVTGAANDETAFTLIYSVNNSVCQGALARGDGNCSASFLLTSSLNSLGTVAGQLFPSRLPLGPVAPVPEP